MVSRRDFRQLDEYLWEVPKGARSDMLVPARLYADKELLEATFEDRSAEQLVNTTTLPGVVAYALAMPDIHQGYGFPIGGVAATRLPSGVISPGGVGYDINCGVRLLRTNLTEEQVRPRLKELRRRMRTVSGCGSSWRRNRVGWPKKWRSSRRPKPPNVTSRPSNPFAERKIRHVRTPRNSFTKPVGRQSNWTIGRNNSPRVRMT